MSTQQHLPRWQERLSKIECDVEDIRFHTLDGKELSQDEEFCEVLINSNKKRIRFHDYHKLYNIPGLYEQLFYARLDCCSPSRISNLFSQVLEDADDDFEDLRVLDVGAGNGMVADELHVRGVENIVGLDIIEEAKEAAFRDRPEVYKDYFVTDLTALPKSDEKKLRKHNFNCLVSVAALGFGDIPDLAFLKALDIISAPGWIAFNIKEDFLSERDDTGFCRLVRQLNHDRIIQMQAYFRYQHRRSISGQPLYYVAMVAKKLKNIPDDLFAQRT